MADAQGAFAVGAVNWANDALEPYSSQGPTSDGRIKPDMVAPSAVKSASYSLFFDGTSAATAHVAGAGALIRQAFPDFGPDDITALLQSRAIKLGPTPANNQFGAGRLNLGQSPVLE
jgi:subtilisin family serine protease